MLLALIDSGDGMRSVVVLTSEQTGPLGEIGRREIGRLAKALAPAGIAIQAHPMSEPLAPGAPALALLVWGYHLDPGAWLDRLDSWEAAGVRLHNPAPALRWNTAKTYLCELEQAGAPVIPTLAVTDATTADLAEARRRFGTEVLVVKPQIGASAHGAEILRPGDRPTLPGPAILQPYYASVRTAGELSLMFFAGRFSHAVRKTPGAGDFRVQEEHGGSSVPVVPPPEAIRAAEQVLEAAPRGLTYARVDLLPDAQGRHRLMELELIEPQLFLAHAPDGGAALGHALAETLAA
jgi:hypothetical protein